MRAMYTMDDVVTGQYKLQPGNHLNRHDILVFTPAFTDSRHNNTSNEGAREDSISKLYNGSASERLSQHYLRHSGSST